MAFPAEYGGGGAGITEALAVTGDLHVAFGITEPNAGTATSRTATRAVRDGDGWRISGQKI